MSNIIVLQTDDGWDAIYHYGSKIVQEERMPAARFFYHLQQNRVNLQGFPEFYSVSQKLEEQINESGEFPDLLTDDILKELK